MISPAEVPPPTGKGPTLPGLITPLQGSTPHALFYDLTHDNESPLHKRSAEDALSTGALVAFSDCATGSVKGFDDLHPKLLDLVRENRRYEIAEKGGIGEAKRILNNLHAEMALQGFEEAHVHQENDVRFSSVFSYSSKSSFVSAVYRCDSGRTQDPAWLSPRRTHLFPKGQQGSRLQSVSNSSDSLVLSPLKSIRFN
jgi:glycogen debranching enzyme